MQLAEEFAIAFYECSSKTSEGVDEIFAFMSLSLYQKAKLKQKEDNKEQLSLKPLKSKKCCI